MKSNNCLCTETTAVKYRLLGDNETVHIGDQITFKYGPEMLNTPQGDGQWPNVEHGSPDPEHDVIVGKTPGQVRTDRLLIQLLEVAGRTPDQVQIRRAIETHAEPAPVGFKPLASEYRWLGDHETPEVGDEVTYDGEHYTTVEPCHLDIFDRPVGEIKKDCYFEFNDRPNFGFSRPVKAESPAPEAPWRDLEMHEAPVEGDEFSYGGDFFDPVRTGGFIQIGRILADSAREYGPSFSGRVRTKRPAAQPPIDNAYVAAGCEKFGRTFKFKVGDKVLATSLSGDFSVPGIVVGLVEHLNPSHDPAYAVDHDDEGLRTHLSGHDNTDIEIWGERGLTLQA